MERKIVLGKIYRANFPNGDVLIVKAIGGEHFRFDVTDGSIFIETLENCISLEEIGDVIENKEGGLK